ncbi:sphingomyelin synthase [Actinomortierella ambigua]|nr:sphingomyelin synthase [Actinomortierella ambigua]
MGVKWKALKRWFLQRYKLSPQSILVTLTVLVVFGLTMYFMNVMANVASSLSPDNTETPKMADRMFEAIPSIQLLWLTDLADAVMFVPTVILILTHYRPLYLLCKVLLTWALCNLMRITTVAITSFPDPRDGCIQQFDDFFTTFTLHRCGDCMFSGHTVIFVISALVWSSHGYHRFPRRYRWLGIACVIFAWILCIGSALIVIANRAHYTVDVLVAFYVAGGNWYIWTYVFDHYIEDMGRLQDLTRPWGNGPDPRPHAQERYRRQKAVREDLEKAALEEDEPPMQRKNVQDQPGNSTDPHPTDQGATISHTAANSGTEGETSEKPNGPAESYGERLSIDVDPIQLPGTHQTNLSSH